MNNEDLVRSLWAGAGTPQQTQGVAKYVNGRLTLPTQDEPKKSNWLLNLLPAAGGIAGGIAGSFVAPVAGTAAGGAAGSALGEFLRQKLSGEKGIGYKKIATEAALGGIPLGVGKGLKAGQATKGIVKGAAGTAVARNATKRIPVKFIEDATMTATKAPVKQVSKNIAINPSLKEVMSATGKPGTVSKLGRIESSGTPYVATKTTTTKIPVSTGATTKTSVQKLPEIMAEKTAQEAVPEAATGAAKTATGKEYLTTSKGGILQRIGKNIQGWSRDVKANLPDPETGKVIGGERADRINKLASEKIFTGKNAYVTGDRKARAVQDYYKNLEKNFVESAEGKRAVGADVHQQMLKKFDESVANSPGLQTKAAKDFTANVRKLVLENPPKTVGEWKQLLTKINKEYSANAAMDTAGSAQKRVYENARQVVKDTFDKLSPEGKRINQEYADAKTLEGVIGKAGKRELNTMSGLFARGAEAAKNVAEPAGRLIERVGAGVSTPIGKIIGRETVPRMFLGGGMSGATQPSQMPQTPSNMQDIYGGADATVTNQTEQAPTSMYPQENYMYDVMRDMQATGGKNVANLTNIYKTMNATTGTAKPMSAEAAKVSAYVKTGLQDVGQLADYIQNNPDINKKTILPGRGVLGNLGNNILGTADYESIRGQAMDSIARLRTGAAISQSEEKRFMAMLPAPMDTQEVAMAKLQRLAAEFQNVLQKTGAAGTDTQQTLMDLYGSGATQQ